MAVKVIDFDATPATQQRILTELDILHKVSASQKRKEEKRRREEKRRERGALCVCVCVQRAFALIYVSRKPT